MLKNISILLPFLVMLFWIPIFLVNRKQNSRSQNIWLSVIIVLAAESGITAFYWYVNGNYSLYYKFDIFEPPVALAFIPVLFLYFRELTGDTNRSFFRTFSLFLPSILFGGVIATFYLLLGEQQAATFSKTMIENHGNIDTDSIPFFFLYRIATTYSLVLFIQAITLFVYAIRRLLLYRKRLNDFFSDIEGKDMEHHWAVFYGIIAILIIIFMIFGFGLLLYIEYSALVAFFRIIFAVTLYYTCYHASLSRYTSSEFTREVDLADEEAMLQGYGIPLEPEVINEDADNSNIYLRFLPVFNQVIDDDKAFLQKNLRIDDVARMVGTNRTYISLILKNEYNCNFWEFINGKRIEYAKEQVLLHPGINQEELTEVCGFSHDSTFSRAFKQCEGITFREWRRVNIPNS